MMATLGSIINGDRPRERRAGFPVSMIHYSKLIPSGKNLYSVDNIQELANMICLSGGVKQNLIAKKLAPDAYELVAGHRRRLAVKYLVEELGLTEYAMMPVHVVQEGSLEQELDLILTNCGARERTDWEKMMEADRLAELLKIMQSGSEEEQRKFRELSGMEPGISARELRQVVAEKLGLSVTKVAQLNHINSSLAPELKKQFQEGKIGVSAANEAASLPQEEQEKLVGRESVTFSDVKKMKYVSESDTDAGGDDCQLSGQHDIDEFLDQEEEEPEESFQVAEDPEKAVPSAFPMMKNHTQRSDFVDAYETWPLWIETKETGERYYRYALPDGTAMVVKVYHSMLFDWKSGAGQRRREGYGCHEYYLLQEGKFFKDCKTNKTALIEKLKEIQKINREG